MKPNLVQAAILCAAVAGVCVAGDLNLNFKNPAARRSAGTYRAAQQKAEAEYESRMKAARTALISALESAEKATTKRGDLDDALLMRTAREELQKVRKAEPPRPNRQVPLREALVNTQWKVTGERWIYAPEGKLILADDSGNVFKEGKWYPLDVNTIGVELSSFYAMSFTPDMTKSRLYMKASTKDLVRIK